MSSSSIPDAETCSTQAPPKLQIINLVDLKISKFPLVLNRIRDFNIFFAMPMLKEHMRDQRELFLYLQKLEKKELINVLSPIEGHVYLATTGDEWLNFNRVIILSVSENNIFACDVETMHTKFIKATNIYEMPREAYDFKLRNIPVKLYNLQLVENNEENMFDAYSRIISATRFKILGAVLRGFEGSMPLIDIYDDRGIELVYERFIDNILIRRAFVETKTLPLPWYESDSKDPNFKSSILFNYSCLESRSELFFFLKHEFCPLIDTNKLYDDNLESYLEQCKEMELIEKLLDKLQHDLINTQDLAVAAEIIQITDEKIV